MGADWVEVPKQSDFKRFIRYAEISEDLFDHEFGLAVRVGDTNADATRFFKWQLFGCAVDGC
ncbi:hypothetical protein D3C87_1827050 [compost metagenome]